MRIFASIVASSVLFTPLVSTASATGVSNNGNCLAFDVDARIASHETAAYFASWNIDSSEDREFFVTDFASPELIAAATGLGAAGGTHIRFGGTGNNFLRYGVGAAPPCSAGEPTCLNETHWEGMITLAANARSPIIFGVNFGVRRGGKNKTFDPKNAMEFFEFAHARGDHIWGVENGNEINLLLTAEEQATGLMVLDDALKIVYGNDPRPFLVGPDALGIHMPGLNKTDDIPTGLTIKYLSDFVVAMDGRLRAVTHHEYSESGAK